MSQQLYTMTIWTREQYGQHDRSLRPAFDSAPDYRGHLTEREMDTLRRRIGAYLDECRARREKEMAKP